MPATLEPSSSKAETQVGRYQLRDLLGEGGMGQVYRAEDSLLHRQVAIKLMKSEFVHNEEFLQRFLREARLAASIEHDCIVPIYDLGQDNGVWYLAMQLLQGCTLQDYLKTHKIPPLGPAIAVVTQVLRGLAVAHHKGLIHRDIKPSNLWLETLPGEDKFRCRILDFGLASNDATDGFKTATGTGTFGTMHYMPFEQLNQEKVDHRADIYSVGVVFYEMLTGRLPYQSPSPVAMALEMWEGPPPAPNSLNPEVPAPISDLVMKMLVLTRDQRIGSAPEVLKELEQIVKNPDGAPMVTGTLPEFVPIPGSGSDPSPKPMSLADFEPAKVELQNLQSTGTGGNLEPWTRPPMSETTPYVPDQLPEPRAATSSTKPSVADLNDPPNPSKKLTIPSWCFGLLAACFLGGIGIVFSAARTPQETASKKTDTHAAEVHPEPVVKHKEPHHAPDQGHEKKAVDSHPKPSKPRPEMIDATAVKGQSAESLRAIQKAWAEHLDLPPVLSVSLDQHVKMEFVLIPPGKFVMGSSASDAIQAMRSDSKMEAKQLEREQPAHQVTISQPFYLGRFEVTRAEFAALHGKMPLRGKPRLPMNRLTWDEAKEFCDELSHTHLPHGVRLATLPTEAQWEFACRGGTRTAFHFGDSLSGVEANCNGSIAFGSRVKGLNREELLEVGSFAPNALGLYDMHGNVAEWCLDGWSEFAYRAEGRTDPVVPASENQHVFRGGSWDDFARSCRSAHRNWTDANNKTDYVGFRVVLIISDPAEH